MKFTVQKTKQKEKKEKKRSSKVGNFSFHFKTHLINKRQEYGKDRGDGKRKLEMLERTGKLKPGVKKLKDGPKRTKDSPPH